MIFKKFCDQLNIVKQCKKFDLSLWQCPNFLTILIGVVTIAAMIGTYVIGNKYTGQPELIVLIVIGIAAFLIVVGYFIIQSFTHLAIANQMKTEFVSIASHQLRTPLSIIKWTINLITDEEALKTNPKLQSYVKDMEESNQRMINLVNDLLNVSRIEQNRVNKEPKRLNLVEITKEKIEEYGVLAKASNLSVGLQAKAANPFIWIDAQQIKIIIQNLLDNAIRYSKPGSGQITISINNKNGFVIWKIKDNGVGIPDKDKRKIFQKFFRSQNALRYQTQGTGLGLFIARAFIRSSGGNMNFESQEGKGSTFWFALPIKQ